MGTVVGLLRAIDHELPGSTVAWLSTGTALKSVCSLVVLPFLRRRVRAPNNFDTVVPYDNKESTLISNLFIYYVEVFLMSNIVRSLFFRC